MHLHYITHLAPSNSQLTKDSYPEPSKVYLWTTSADDSPDMTPLTTDVPQIQVFLPLKKTEKKIKLHMNKQTTAYGMTT
jgi:hypothetical protein